MSKLLLTMETRLLTYSIVRRMGISFALGFILPALIFLYLWDKVQSELYPILVLSTTASIGLGFYFIWEMVQQMLAVSHQAKALAEGRTMGLGAPTRRQDELGDLSFSIHNIAQNVEQKMQELQATAAVLEKTKKALSETTLYADSIIRSMAEAMIVLDRDMKVKSANRAASVLLGYEQSDLIGREIHTLINGDTPEGERLVDDLKHAVERIGVLRERRAVLVAHDGEQIPVDMNIAPLQYSADPSSGVVIVSRDMRKILTLFSQLEQANQSLEAKVRERSAEMEQAYRELKEKDAQILHQEKMASIGLLAAGIAHEINNPIGYINSNLDVLGEYVADIASYTRKLESVVQILPKDKMPPSVGSLLDEAAQLKDSLGVDDVFEDLGKLGEESKGGIDRVKRIVADLRNFSHADENKLEYSDINAGIESTLNIVWNELKYRAQVHKSYGDLPLVRCYPQQLNQVFMNLLVNAAQALEGKGEIWIKTYAVDEAISVEISDTGSGISSENLQKIFEPFFTTKGVGKGTGLGLSIAYSIIKKHQGEINVKSEMGKGTTFTIRLPLDLKEDEDEEANDSRGG